MSIDICILLKENMMLLSCVRLFATPCTVACQACLSFTISWSLLKLMSIESVDMPSNHLILCSPPLLLPFIFLSIRVFSNSRLFASGGQSIGASAEYDRIIIKSILNIKKFR